VTTYINLVLCICVSICTVSAQAYKKVDIKLKDELIDLVSLEDDHVHLITSKGIYDFNILDPSPLALLKDKTIRQTSQNYSHKDKVCFFPLKFGGYVAYNKNHKVLKIESGNLEDGILLQTRNGHKWLANNSLYKNIDGKWKHKHNITSFSGLTDGKSYKDNIWLCSRSEGVYKFDYSLKMEHYDQAQGLLSNNCTALHVIDSDNAVIGHKGGLSTISPEGIEHIDLNNEIGTEPILELEMDNAGMLWILSSRSLISLENGHKKSVDLDLNDGEELVAIHLGSDQNIWLLSNQSLYVIPNTELKIYTIPSDKQSESILDFYQIRDKNYLSDGRKVYSLAKGENNWNIEPKKEAPVTVINDKKGNPSLIFKNNKGIKLSTKNAKIIKKLSIPETEEIINIDLIKDRKYYSTKSNLYEVYANELKLLSHKEDQFYKVLETENGIFAFAQNGIYKVQDDKIVPLLATYKNATYPFSRNQFQIDNKLFVAKNNSIQIIETLNESIQDVPLRPLEILDVHENGTLVWLFCSKSIVALDKGKLTNGKAEIVKVIPIYQQLDKGQMYKLSDDEIWAMGKDKVFRIKVNDPITAYTPKMFVYKVTNSEGEELSNTDNIINVQNSDFPLSVSYNGTNFWTDKINYAYHLNYDGKNISEWRSENTYEMNYIGPGKYTLNAKFKDDIYGVNVSASKVVINVNSEGRSGSHRKKKWLPIIVISSLILCCLYFLTRKRSEG